MTLHSPQPFAFDARSAAALDAAQEAPALAPAKAHTPALAAGAAAPAAGAAVRSGLYRGFGKRGLDLVLVILALPVLVPLVGLLALAVALDGGRPFYAQDRIGLGGRVFRMWKLRSMVIDADARLEAHLAADPAARAEWDATQKLKSDPRITPIGRVLRKCSADELPQLFNVLKGDMSLVGPRPMMVCQQPLYPGTSYFRMRPGVTGFWQISERNAVRFEDRVGFDDAYEARLSLATDLTVLWRTVAVVLRGTGY
jgi:lipopolysaccharide/colanic/teichoic acid biosynthesis glycosyltransferase